jgi:hypothetical protein
MLFYVKCVRCGRIATVKSVESVAVDSADEQANSEDPRLGGYITRCPACEERRTTHQPPAPVSAAYAA